MWSSLSGFDFLGFVEGGLVFGLMACFIIFDGMLDIEIRNILEITWSPGYFFLPPEKICFWHVVRLEADHFNPVRDLADSRLDFTHCKADLCCSYSSIGLQRFQQKAWVFTRASLSWWALGSYFYHFQHEIIESFE